MQKEQSGELKLSNVKKFFTEEKNITENFILEWTRITKVTLRGRSKITFQSTYAW